MNIGLVQVDGKWANLALMKISAYHKAKGHNVEWFNPMFDYDAVYYSKIFKFTPDYNYLPMNGQIIKGGSGYNNDRLSLEIDNCFPDYSIYPNIDYSIGFTTRGCIRNCPFCIVPEKEGSINIVGDLYSIWGGHKVVLFLDNNITAAPIEHFEKIIYQCIKERVQIQFTQGLDIRLLTDDHAYLLSKVRHYKQIFFAWDMLHYEKSVIKGVETLYKYFNRTRHFPFACYVLIGYNTKPEEDLYRVETLRSIGVDPYVMPFNKKDNYQRRFARWVNHRAIFKSTKWTDYKG